MRPRSGALCVAAVLLAASVDTAGAADAPGAPETGAAIGPASGPAAAEAVLSIFYLVDVDGAFASLSCRGAADLAAARTLDFATTLDGLDRARAASRARGELEPVALFGGNLIAPGAYGRTLLDRPGGPAALADLLVRAGADHLSLGTHEFDAAPAALDAFLAAAEARGLRAHVANAECDPAKGSVCRWIGDADGRVPRRYRIVERGGFRIAIVSLLDEEAAHRAPAGHADGLTLRDPAAAARETIYRIRMSGAADAIILVAHLEHASTAPRAVLDLVRGLRGAEAPDLVIANGLYPPGGARGTIDALRLSDGAPPIVGTAPYGLRPGVTRLRFTRVAPAPGAPGPSGASSTASTVRVTVEPPGEVDVSPDRFSPDLRATSLSETDRWCASAGAPLGAGRLFRPLDAGELTTYTLEVMRRTAGADVALINAGAIDASASFPLTGYVSADDLGRALPFGDEVVVAHVKGEELERFLKQRWRLTKLRDARALRVAGPATTDGGATFKLNGRPIDPDVPYEVVTIAWVAGGGDDILEGFAGAKWKWTPYRVAGAPAKLPTLVAAWLTDRVRPRLRAPVPPIGVPEDFRRLEDRFLWDLRFDGNAGLTDVTIRSSLPSDETAAVPQFARDQLTSLVADLKLAVYVDSSEHGVEWTAHYAFGWSAVDVLRRTRRDVAVNTDVLTSEAIYRLRFFKKAVGPDHWYVPEPYVATFLESELVPAPDCAGPFWGCLGRTATFTTGYRFKFGPKLELKIGAGMKTSGVGLTLQPPVFVAELGFKLMKYKIAAPGGVPINLQSEATAYSGERFDEPGVLETEVRATTVLDVALGYNLFFTLTQTFYALTRYDFNAAPGMRFRGGLSSDVIAAIRVDLDLRIFDYD